MIKNKDYLSITRMDATGMLRSAIGSGRITSADDGSYELNMRMSDITPWLFIKNVSSTKCYLWHHVYFEHCDFIPTPCYSCWKIVVRPANIKAAFDFHDIMQYLDFPSKIGWEARPTVFGTFGAYFYNRSLDEAKRKLPQIQDAASRIELLKNPFTGETIKPIIKRGCTEFEHKFGPSDKWEMSEKDKLKEKTLEELITFNNKNFPQPDHRAATIFRLWIHNAFMMGDQTVSEFTGGNPLYPPYVTYQEEKENGQITK